MPPRWLTWTIIGFWAATTGWMAYREVLLHYRAGEPPPFTIDLTDEVGANTIPWTVLKNGEKVGLGYSSVRCLPDRSFEFASVFRFPNMKLKLLQFIEFKKIKSEYRVTADGELLGLQATVFMENVEVQIGGQVEDGFFVPRVRVKFNGTENEVPVGQKIKISRHGSVLNPMHLLNKLNGLRTGQRWTIRMLDPAMNLAGQSLTIPILEAQTSADTLSWHETDVPCFKIEYHEPGKNVIARTWVRARDGVVLQQEARHQNWDLILQRDK